MTERVEKISVIVPLYNGAEFISTTLSSLERQTAVISGDVALEVIVVDDGSTDDGPEAVARHPLKTVYLSQPNLGVAVARNRGAAAATGEWLAFLDQDDLWHETRLERILPRLRSAEAPLVLTAERSFATTDERDALRGATDLAVGVDAWIEKGTELESLCGPGSIASEADGPDVIYTVETLMRRTVAMSTSFFVSAAHLRLVGGWTLHAKSIDDWWLLTNSARIAPILFVDQPTLLYRLHVRATSRSTAFFYPFATALLALRFGGQVETLHHALESDLSNLPAQHLLHAAMYSDEFRRIPGSRAFAWHAAHLLWPRGHWRVRFLKAWLRRTQRHLSHRSDESSG